MNHTYQNEFFFEFSLVGSKMAGLPLESQVCPVDHPFQIFRVSSPILLIPFLSCFPIGNFSATSSVLLSRIKKIHSKSNNTKHTTLMPQASFITMYYLPYLQITKSKAFRFSSTDWRKASRAGRQEVVFAQTLTKTSFTSRSSHVSVTCISSPSILRT